MVQDTGTNNGKIELQKNLNLSNCISIIVGIIVGSGIFISPKVFFVEMLIFH